MVDHDDDSSFDFEDDMEEFKNFDMNDDSEEHDFYTGEDTSFYFKFHMNSDKYGRVTHTGMTEIEDDDVIKALGKACSKMLKYVSCDYSKTGNMNENITSFLDGFKKELEEKK